MESEIEFDDKSFHLVRKNLNILSILIILLAFTNASLESLNFLGIQLRLDSHRFYIALLTMYLYFIWRFWTKLKIREGFWNDFTKYFLENKDALASKYNFERYRHAFAQQSEELSQAIKNDPKFRVIQISFNRDSQSLLELRMVANFYIEFRRLNNSSDLQLAHSFRVSRLFFVRKLLRFCVAHDKFGDYLFPLVPVTVNLFLFLLNHEWQGSLHSLIYDE